MSPGLSKRRVWRPRDETGTVIAGGAGGFHLPQREGRYSYIAPPPKSKRRHRRKASP